MPFQYQTSQSPAAGSIAELMLRRGDIRAQQAAQVAAAQARAAEVSGNAYAGAAQNIGQSVAGAIAQATDPKRQMESLQLQEAKTGIAEHDTFKKILKDTPPVDENGMKLYDLGTLASKATAAGIDPSAYLEHYANVNTGFRNEYQARLATVQAGAQGLMLAPDATLAKDFLDRLKANNTITADVHQHLTDLIDADPSPANITRIATPFAGKQTPVMGKPGETPLNPITSQPMGPSLPSKPVAVRPGGSMVNPDTGAVVATVPQQAPLANPETVRHNTEMERIAGLNAGKADAAQKETERHNRAVEAQGEAAPALTPDAIKLTAHQFAMTGQLPPMGMGKTGAKVRTDIINAAADEYKNLDLPSQVAAYKANQASLTKLQGVADKVTAFESTAGKNLDQFLALADKIPDTGVPWLNTPIRLVNDKMVGSENQAAANAARDVALREIARVTNDPNLSGVISDSARKEVSSLSPQNATFAQIKAVAKVLKQDMANVHSSLNEQIGAVQQRIATPPGGAAPAVPAKPAAAAPTMIEAKDPQGNIHHAPAGTPLPAGWTLVKP